LGYFLKYLMQVTVYFIYHRIHGKNSPQMTQIFADYFFESTKQQNRRFIKNIKNIKNREPLKNQIVSHKADKEPRRILTAKDTKIHEKYFLSTNGHNFHKFFFVIIGENSWIK
jgi:hypothetical protein